MKPLLTTELQQEVVAALSPEIPCEGREEHADVSASWWMALSCHCPTRAYCDTCHEVVLGYIADRVRLGCLHCGATDVAITFEPLR